MCFSKPQARSGGANGLEIVRHGLRGWISLPRLARSMRQEYPEEAPGDVIDRLEQGRVREVLAGPAPSIRHLAGLPSAHAISASGAGWRRLEPAHAREEADRAERVFVEAARRLTRRRFEIVRGGAARALEAISRSDDIVVIVAPAAAADRAAEPFASLLDAAFRSSAAVMLAPPRIARVTGCGRSGRAPGRRSLLCLFLGEARALSPRLGRLLRQWFTRTRRVRLFDQ